MIPDPLSQNPDPASQLPDPSSNLPDPQAPDPTAQVPDPNGPPVLSYYGKKMKQRAVSAIVMASIGGGAMLTALLVLGTSTTRTSGALRSHRIQWQQRQQEIAAVQAQSDAAESPAAQPAEPTHD